MVRLVALCLGGCHLSLVRPASGARQQALVRRSALGSLMWSLWWGVVTVIARSFGRLVTRGADGLSWLMLPSTASLVAGALFAAHSAAARVLMAVDIANVSAVGLNAVLARWLPEFFETLTA